MPQFIPVANVAQVEIRALLWGQKIQNTLYYSRIGGDIGEGALDDLAQQVSLRWYDHFRTLLPRAYVFQEVITTDLSSATSPTGSWPGVIPWNGGHSDSTTMPGALTLAVAFRSSQRGRNFRGRNFWPGLPRNEVSGNAVTQLYAMGIQAAYSKLLPGGADPVVNWQWVIVSRYLNKQPRTEGAIIPVTDVAVADYDVDCQRRRLTGRGQ